MFSTINNVKIAAIAAAVPKKNQDILQESSYANERERAKFIKMTGVVNRRLSSVDQCTSDFCFASAEKLLNDLKWNRDEIDILVFVTQTPDYILPATAIVLQDRLGLSKSCAAFDINLGCSGYAFGIQVVASMLSSLTGKKALLLVGDTSSKGVMPSSLEMTPPLFGDCGTATALEWAKDAPPIHIECGSDGSGFQHIMHEYGMYRNPFNPDIFKSEINEDGNLEIYTGFKLDGHAIFNFSIKEVPVAVKSLLAKSDIDFAEIDYFVFHQANKIMNELIRKTLKIDVEKHPYTLDKYGNTSSATVPLTIVSELKNKLEKDKSYNLLVSGFGVGLSWGSAILSFKNVYIPEVIEL
jgi:3-oxoacyl-[acyl-carrier-protein] synthase III